jgi:hypothetical protein
MSKPIVSEVKGEGPVFCWECGKRLRHSFVSVILYGHQRRLHQTCFREIDEEIVISRVQSSSSDGSSLVDLEAS